MLQNTNIDIIADKLATTGATAVGFYLLMRLTPATLAMLDRTAAVWHACGRAYINNHVVFTRRQRLLHAANDFGCETLRILSVFGIIVTASIMGYGSVLKVHRVWRQ